VSAFWTRTSTNLAIGYIHESGLQPLVYTGGTLPEAVPLDASLLQTLSTYQSKESGTQSGIPSGESDLLDESSTGALTERDYRWAIEQGNIGTFVPSSYTDPNNFATRQLFSDTSDNQEYRREGSGDLTAHGGEDQRLVSGYPALGRVWEICSGSTLPFLVWEERSCSGGGTGGSTTTTTTTLSTTELAAAAGLTEAEYAAFLASGLTLEQFKAARLAATGPDSALLMASVMGSVLLMLAGLVLIASRRRSQSPRRL